MTKQVLWLEEEEGLRHEGLTPEPEIWEDGLRVDPVSGTFEWWYFDAHFDDGSTAVVVYATKPMLQRNDPLVPMVSLSITPAGGEKQGILLFYPPAQFEAAQERCEVHIGPHWVHGDLHHYELHVEGQELAADLVFTGVVPPWRPGAGKSYYDEALSRYFAWLAVIPYGHVEGSLTCNGKTWPVRGEGYHDHNWGNIGPEQVISNWVWGRAHIGDFTAIFVEIVSSPEYGHQKLPVFMLAKGRQILAGDGRPLTLAVSDPQDHPSGKQYPRSLDFHWQAQGGTAHIALRQPRLIETFSLLDGMPAWKHWLIRLFTNPYYFRFNADMELSVDLNGIKAVERGTALYELMMLR